MAKSKIDLKFLSLSQLERSQDTSVWVFNNSNPRGIINMQTNDGLGNTVAMRIGISWMPLDLTTQATKQSIVTNPQFRRLVSGEMIKIVDPEQAREIAESSAGRAELKRLFDMEAIGQSNEIQIPDVLKKETATGVSGFVMSLVNRSDIDEDAAIAALRGQEGVLTDKDWRYLAENSPFSCVKEFAVEHL